MKIHILASLKEGPSGGGNHFLINLRKELNELGVYERSIEKANVVLINSHNSISDFPNIQVLVEGKAVVHRMDGLQKLYNYSGDTRQDLSIRSNRLATHTIFQSKWSKDEYEKICKFKTNTVIHNAASSEFFPLANKTFAGDQIRVVTSCWSKNKNKGFDFLTFIDSNLLKFPEIKFSFIGNSPIRFKNINVHDVSDRFGVSKVLRDSDIYFHPSRFEACSNSLLEGLACGLPSVYIDSGSNKEVVGEGGLQFTSEKDVFDKIKALAREYELYRNNIPVRTMRSVAEKYCDECSKALTLCEGWGIIYSSINGIFN